MHTGPVSPHMAAYLNREREKLDRFVQENETGRKDEEIMDSDEPIVLDNPIFEHLNTTQMPS